MSVYTWRFDTKTIENLLDVDAHTVRQWIQRGNLQAMKTMNGDREQWEVKGGDLIEFVYFNPKYRNSLEAMVQENQDDRLTIYRVKILREVYRKRPILYSIYDICDFLDVSDSAVHYWARAKGLEQVQSPRAISYHLYTIDALKQI